MFQYYLRDAGVSLSWVGSGRLLFSIDWTDVRDLGAIVRFRRYLGDISAMFRRDFGHHAAVVIVVVVARHAPRLPHLPTPLTHLGDA